MEGDGRGREKSRKVASLSGILRSSTECITNGTEKVEKKHEAKNKLRCKHIEGDRRGREKRKKASILSGILRSSR